MCSSDLDWAVFLGTIDGQAKLHPEVQVVRLDQWMAAHEPDGSWRPDGLHLTLDAATTVADQLLGPLLIDTGRR